MNWGTEKQSHYRTGRNIKEVNLQDIEAICDCGYITLSPQSDFENHNGGLTIKRSNVRIIREDGSIVQKLRGKNIMKYSCCNACVNDWK